jgi:hypothetical protein
MKDSANIMPVFERFVGWTTEQALPPMAEFILADGTPNKAGFPRVEHMYKNKDMLHPSDQTIVSIAYRSFAP